MADKCVQACTRPGGVGAAVGCRHHTSPTAPVFVGPSTPLLKSLHPLAHIRSRCCSAEGSTLPRAWPLVPGPCPPARLNPRPATAPCCARYDAPPAAILAPRGSRQAALLAALAPLQGEEPSLALGAAGPDLTALTYLRAAASSDADLVRAGWRLKASAADTELACRVMGRLAAPSSAATEGAVLGALAGYIQGALAAYPTTLQQDEQELAALTAAAAGGGAQGAASAAGANNSSSSSSSWGDAQPTTAEPGGSNSSSRMRVQVLRALISEKRALQGSEAVVGRWQQRLAGGKVALGAVYEGLMGGAGPDDM